MSAFAGFDDRMTAEERTLLRDLEEEEARAGHTRTHIILAHSPTDSFTTRTNSHALNHSYIGLYTLTSWALIVHG